MLLARSQVTHGMDLPCVWTVAVDSSTPPCPLSQMSRQRSKQCRASGNNGAASKALMAASEAAMRGDWLRCADSYARAYKASSCDWDLLCNCVSGYTSVLAENHFQPRPEDMQLLKDIAKDESAPPLHRSKAAVTRGLMYWLKNDRELAKTEYRRAIKIAEGVSTSERERKVLLNTHEGLRWVSQGPLFDEALTVTRGNLDVLEGRLQATKVQQLDDKLTLSQYSYCLPLGQSADAAESVILSAFFNADPPSAACGAEGVELRKCGGCRRAFYCSAACNAAAWQEHKQDCRKKAFLPGDLIKITTAPADVGINPVGNISCNGYILEIVDKATQRDGY